MSHVIVIGLGQVGFRVARLLQRMGEQVIVVTDKAGRDQFQEILVDAGVEILYGDARNPALLKRANPEAAKAFLCCTSQDLVNIEVALDARKFNPKAKIVVRMFDQDLARHLMNPLKFDHALAMSSLSAPSFALSAIGVRAVGSFENEKGKFTVLDSNDNLGTSIGSGERVVPQGELKDRLGFAPTRVHLFQEMLRSWRLPLIVFKNAARPLKFSAATILMLFLLSIPIFQFGGGMNPLDAVYFITTTLTTTGYGDISLKDRGWLTLYTCFLMLMGSAAVATLYSFVTDFVISSRFDQMLGRQWVKHAKHVVVVGLGSVGYRTVMECRSLGIPVVAIDIEPSPRFRARLGELDFVAGDARDPETLRRAGIEQAMAVVACTDNDAVNLGVALVVKELNATSRTVVRLFDGNFSQKVEHALPVDQTLSASRIAAPGFVGAALWDNWQMSYIDGDLLRVVIDDGAGGYEIAERKLQEVVGEF